MGLSRNRLNEFYRLKWNDFLECFRQPVYCHLRVAKSLRDLAHQFPPDARRRHTRQQVLEIPEDLKMLINRGSQTLLEILLHFSQGGSLRSIINILALGKPHAVVLDNEN